MGTAANLSGNLRSIEQDSAGHMTHYFLMTHGVVAPFQISLRPRSHPPFSPATVISICRLTNGIFGSHGST